MTDLRNYIKYLPSQENIGCCTASASLLALEIAYSIVGTYNHFSRFKVKTATKVDNSQTNKG